MAVKPSGKLAWHVSDKSDVAPRLFDELHQIQQEQRERYNRNIRCVRLYGAMDTSGLFPSAFSQNSHMPDNRVRYNLIASCVDTICAKISKLRTKITFLTAGGAWSAQQKAKMLTKFMFGMFTANKVWTMHQKAFKDSTIFDIGALKHYRIGNRIVTERVLPTELHFDIVDAIYGDPKLLYQVKNVDKSTLLAMFPERKKVVQTAKVNADEYTPITFDLSGQATVVEAWKLPSVPGGDDGRHVISCSEGTLLDEPWDRDDFPFTFFRWTEMPVGAYSQSLADRLTGNQIEINKLLRVIQRAFHLGSVFKVFLEYGSKVVKEQLNNDIGGYVYYSGTKPEVSVPKVVSNEMFQHLNWLIDKGYEETGVSQLSAAAKRPSGVDAKVALRELQDIETERFALTAMAYEDSFVQTAKWYVALAKEIDADGEELAVLAESKKFVEKIKWSDIQVEDNDIIIQKFPTSTLPQTPAGKLQYVQDLIEAGLVEPGMAKRLLDFPDTEAYTSLDSAALDTIFDCIDQMISHGRYVSPEPYMDLANGIKWVQAAYNRGLIDDVPEARMELLRDWMTNANTLMERAAAEAAAKQAAAQPPMEAPPPEIQPTEGEPSSTIMPQ